MSRSAGLRMGMLTSWCIGSRVYIGSVVIVCCSEGSEDRMWFMDKVWFQFVRRFGSRLVPCGSRSQPRASSVRVTAYILGA